MKTQITAGLALATAICGATLLSKEPSSPNTNFLIGIGLIGVANPRRKTTRNTSRQ